MKSSITIISGIFLLLFNAIGIAAADNEPWIYQGTEKYIANSMPALDFLVPPGTEIGTGLKAISFSCETEKNCDPEFSFDLQNNIGPISQTLGKMYDPNCHKIDKEVTYLVLKEERRKDMTIQKVQSSCSDFINYVLLIGPYNQRIVPLADNYNQELLDQIVFSVRRKIFFSDIPSELNDILQYLVQHNIVSGYLDNTFRPQNPINRAEFTKIIVGAVHEAAEINACPLLSSVSPFPDVSADDWFMPYTCSARRFKIMDGYPDGTFRPAQNINVAEASKIVAGAFGLTSTETPWPANRSPEGEGWYQPYMDALNTLGALPASAQDPAHLLTRGEMAEIVYRVMER